MTRSPLELSGPPKYYNSKYWCIADFCHYIPGAVILLILSTRLSGPSLSADCKAPRYIGNWHYPPPHPGENRTAPDYRWGLDLSSRHTPSTLRLRHHNQDEHDDDHDEVWILPADTHRALFVSLRCLCILYFFRVHARKLIVKMIEICPRLRRQSMI